MLLFKQFSLSLILFVVLDFIWLGYVMKDFNMRQLANIGRIENGVFQLHYPAAIATYVLMALGVALYVLPQLTAQASLGKVFMTGAVLGLIVYGVFDLTNLAILKNYPVAFIAPDMAWGAFVFGAVSVAAFKLSN